MSQLRKITLRVDEIEYDILTEYCWNNRISPSDVFRKFIRDHLDTKKITIKGSSYETLIQRICGRTQHSPLFVERILIKYHENWKLQAQALFRVSDARLETATCLEDILDDKEPNYENLAVAISKSTGYRPTQVEKILKRYPHNIELQFLELFRALQPRIEGERKVSLKIGDNRQIFDLTSLDELSREVHNELRQTLPTEFDIARLTELIDKSGQEELPSDKDFNTWLQSMKAKNE